MGNSTFRIAASDLENLAEQGYFIRDDFLDDDTCRILRRDVDRQAREGELVRPGIGRGGGYQRDETIRGDFITWLDSDSRDYPWSTVAERFEHLRTGLNRRGYLGLSDCDIQIARYPGDGTGYDRHLDAFAGDANRRVTSIVYLNCDWQPSNGGKLRLYPEDGPNIDIEPLAGRLVTFFSDELEHGVLPSFAPRFAVTSWYRGAAPFRVAI